jgi:hypothetical protein
MFQTACKRRLVTAVAPALSDWLMQLVNTTPSERIMYSTRS